MRRRQLRHQDKEAGQESLIGGEAGPVRPLQVPLPAIPQWPEADRLAREKEVIGFFISGHPLERYRAEVELFGTRTTATLSQWGEHPVAIAAVITAVKRQISKKTGKEYARVTLEDFHGTAEAIVFPESWARLSQAILPDRFLFAVHAQAALGELNNPSSGAVGPDGTLYVADTDNHRYFYPPHLLQ